MLCELGQQQQKPGRTPQKTKRQAQAARLGRTIELSELPRSAMFLITNGTNSLEYCRTEQVSTTAPAQSRALAILGPAMCREALAAIRNARATEYAKKTSLVPEEKSIYAFIQVYIGGE